MGICDVKCYDEIQTMVSMWDIGASGAHTKTSGVPGTGFASVAETAAGKYTITFARGTPLGRLIDLEIRPWHVADEEAYVARVTTATWTPETQADAATVKYESWIVDDTAAQTDWPDTAQVTIKATFLKTT